MIQVPKIDKLTDEQRKKLNAFFLERVREKHPHLFKEPTEEQKAMIEKFKREKGL